jgi:hypothetical protein
MANAWENFDGLTAAVVNNEISFFEYTRRADVDFSRMSRIASRRKHLPAWIDVEDVKTQLMAHAWHYLFERVARDGTVGFDPNRYRNPGAYVRQKIRQKISKDLSKARGENQNTRKGPAAPEYLSKTGELGGPGGLPDLGDDNSAAESMVDRARGLDALKKLATTLREFTILQALAQGMGDDRRVVAFLLREESRSACGFSTEREVIDGLDRFVNEWSKKHGAISRGKKQAKP